MIYETPRNFTNCKSSRPFPTTTLPLLNVTPISPILVSRQDDDCSFCYELPADIGDIGGMSGFPADPQVQSKAGICVALCRGSDSIITLPDGRIAMVIEVPADMQYAGGAFLFLAGLINLLVPPYGTGVEEAVDTQLILAGLTLVLVTATLVIVASSMDFDPCSQENIERLIGGRTVADVIYDSVLSDIIDGRTIKPIQDTVDKPYVVKDAMLACNGSPFPPAPVARGATYDALLNGHHRFIASRLISGIINMPLEIIVSRDFSASGFDFPSKEWINVKW